MNNLAEIIKQEKLLEKDQKSLDKLKNTGRFTRESSSIYRNSLYLQASVLYFIGRIGNKKNLFAVSKTAFKTGLAGSFENTGGIFIFRVTLDFNNSLILKKLFPFTEAISLRDKCTTFGCGDRLGLAGAGHIRAAKKYQVYPVLAQQSIRELTLTGRTYHDVTAAAVFLVFQEGYESGYGADGDHLKTLDDIDTALSAGMPMITLDLSEVMNAQAANWQEKRLDDEFEKMPDAEKKYLFDNYADKTFTLGKEKIEMGRNELKKCAVMYHKALDFAAEVDRHLRSRRQDHYDLEISIDETTAPTLPSHHLFIISELKRRRVTVNSLAPRFIGEFQKGIDYIGDKAEFEKQFRVHCAIAAKYGNYKISIHSGSDKFSVYPLIGKYTGCRLHAKTAGTSWLEAMRTIAGVNPALYRKMHKKSFACFEEAKKLYHITADLSKIMDIDKMSDAELPGFLEQNESRQLLHITYGGLLKDPEVRSDFFNTLDEYEDRHYDLVEMHITRHMKLLGIAEKK
ncbi:MAG: hypothetical protein A2096_04155 [Spirochaetes bacterium GWF1_41_5]|nr:MAG: hypothetical protein A2096_04155 [Spirochaetes bacterium GWF1_41_5]HBE01024.1 hypothetical protein [Spirochaetia bacterium]